MFVADEVMDNVGVSIEEGTQRVTRLIDNIETIIFGKRDAIKMCVIGLLSRGHILIEDIPGIGKTTLAQGLAKSLNCDFSRVQFTNDMLPADILGVSILDPKTNNFDFRHGPIFSNIVLADEINRTPPKTQSALLEAMSEFHVSVDGKTRALPDPFLVLATQNPIEYEGTYTLPEAQLDRFLIRVEIGYPAVDDELRVMRRHNPLKALEDLTPVLSGEEVVQLQSLAQQVHVDDSVARYILAIVNATREAPMIRLGVSPRGSLALFEASQALALINGRNYVTPGDVKSLVAPVLSHRVIAQSYGNNRVPTPRDRDALILELVEEIPVPV
jgi:MoxR-like ATPase